MPRRLTKKEQQFIIDRAKGRCEYCQWWQKYAPQPYHNDHITPDSKDGLTTLDNLARACGGCNGSKYNKTEAIDPLTKQLAPLFHPRQQAWKAHFAWSEDTTLIVGLTATGRVTIETLKMNRPELQSLRAVFRDIGVHPPKD